MLFFKRKFDATESKETAVLTSNTKRDCPFKDLINFEGIVSSVSPAINGYQDLTVGIVCNGKSFEVNCFSNKKIFKVGEKVVVVGRDFVNFKYFVE